MKRKRSSCIHLLLIGAAGVLTASCDDSTRYTYTSREDCVREWGEADCQPDDDDRSRSGIHHSRHYSAVKKSSARPRTVTSSASSVRRGGFGSSFRSSGG
jgi:uncharacterized protein YgiB involved in biofilm formation